MIKGLMQNDVIIIAYCGADVFFFWHVQLLST